jgi:hypothetical protein
MVLLRQVQRPASNANWTEYFYAGELKVVNGEVEVPADKFEWINQLKFRGFEVVGEEEKASPPQDQELDPQLEETIHNQEPFEPLGTQTADEHTDIPESIGEALMPSDYEEVHEEPAEETPEKSDAEPAPAEDDATEIPNEISSALLSYQSESTEDVEGDSATTPPSRSRRKAKKETS